MFFKIRRLRTRLELVFTVLAPVESVPARVPEVCPPVCTCILLQQASCDFVLRRLCGGSP